MSIVILGKSSMKRTFQSPTGHSPQEKKKSTSMSELTNTLQTTDITERKEKTGEETNVEQLNMDTQSMMSGKSSMRMDMERDFSFGRDKTTGPWRDVITIDILTINDDDYKGTVRPREAKDAIYKMALGLDINNLHGIKMEYRGHPVISFRLINPIDIRQ